MLPSTAIAVHAPRQGRQQAGEIWDLQYCLDECAQGKKCSERSDSIEGPFLPHDVVIEILSWMPAQSLLRCKCVCKQWYYLIQDCKFIKQHLSRSRQVFVYWERQVACLNVDGTIQEKFSRKRASRGLVVEKGDVSEKYRVRNPTTHQVLYLPNSRQPCVAMFVFLTNGEFKLLSVCGSSKRRLEGFEVLTIDRDDKWRPLESFPIFNDVVELVFSWDALHVVRRSKGLYNIDSVDMENECLFNNALPSENMAVCLKWEGCVAFVAGVEENLKVIVLEDFKNHRWREFVVHLTFLKENQGLKAKDLRLVCCTEGILYLKSEHENVVFGYDLQLRKITDIMQYQKENAYLFRFQPSLVTFEGMRPERFLL